MTRRNGSLLAGAKGNEEEMTWYEEVKQIWGECTREEAEALLWSCTAFPCCSVETIYKQLEEIKEKSSGDFNRAIQICENELNAALNKGEKK